MSLIRYKRWIRRSKEHKPIGGTKLRKTRLIKKSQRAKSELLGGLAELIRRT